MIYGSDYFSLERYRNIYMVWYQFKTTLKYKNVNYDVQLCYLIATAPDAPSENVKRQIAQGQSEELKFSSSDSESLKKQGSF